MSNEGIEVFAKAADRDSLMSAGAKITNLRVAAAHSGFETTVVYAPTVVLASPIAFVTTRETCNPDAYLRDLFPAITQRRTNRAASERREIDAEALEKVCDVVESSEMLRFVVPHDHPHAAELVEQADGMLMPEERELIENAAGLIVVVSDDYGIALVHAGEALERLLLTLTSLGISYAFLNQPIQVPSLRRELWRLLRSPKPPQQMLRIGYARPVPRVMPRRRLEAVTS